MYTTGHKFQQMKHCLAKRESKQRIEPPIPEKKQQKKPNQNEVPAHYTDIYKGW